MFFLAAQNGALAGQKNPAQPATAMSTADADLEARLNNLRQN